jgi:hypothetical protein
MMSGADRCMPGRVGTLRFGQIEVDLPGMWGSAAWVQSQTPGASALAAPHPFVAVASRRSFVRGRRSSR